MILTGSCKDKPQSYSLPKGYEDSFYGQVRQLKGIKCLKLTDTHLLVTPACTTENARVRLYKQITRIQQQLMAMPYLGDDTMSYQLPRVTEIYHRELAYQFYRRVCQLDDVSNVKLTNTHLLVKPKLSSYPTEEAKQAIRRDLHEEILELRKAMLADYAKLKV